MKLRISPTQPITNMIARPLSTCWTGSGRPLIQPAGPFSGFMIHAVMMVAATPPTIMARTCWSLKRFFIATVPRLAWAHRAPYDRNVLRIRQTGQGLCWVEAKDRPGRVALDHKGAAALAVGSRVGHCDALGAIGDGKIRRDVAAGPDAEI